MISSKLIQHPHLYALASRLALGSGCRRIIHVGVELVEQLQDLAEQCEIVVIGRQKQQAGVLSRFPAAHFIDADLDNGFIQHFDENTLRGSIVICANELQQIVRPERVAADLAKLRDICSWILLSTPDRGRTKGLLNAPFETGGDQWTAAEFGSFLIHCGFSSNFLIGYTNGNNLDDAKDTVLVVAGREAEFVEVPKRNKIAAVLNIYQELDVIESVARYLKDEGIDVHLIDNWSTDGTFERGRDLVRDGVCASISRFPDRPSNQYEWTRQLEHTSNFAASLDADWIMHYDADEIRCPPWAGVSLSRAIDFVDHLQYTAIDFSVINFLFVDRDIVANFSPDCYKWFDWGRHPANFKQVKAWKNVGKIDLVSTGGHEVQFDGKRVYPIKFLTKHYSLRSYLQANHKIYKERLPRIECEHREKGWHVQYDHLRLLPELSPWHKYELLNFSKNIFEAEFLVERISGIGVEQAVREPLNVQSQVSLDGELINQRVENEKLKQEVKDKNIETERLCADNRKLDELLAQKTVEIKELKDQISQLIKPTWAREKFVALRQQAQQILALARRRISECSRLGAIRRRRLDYKVISSSDLFDARWYLDQYPDVRSTGVDAALHYLVHGGQEGRHPSAFFDAERYLASNPDVLKASVNPLVHYCRYGRQEGRIVFPVLPAIRDGDPGTINAPRYIPLSSLDNAANTCSGSFVGDISRNRLRVAIPLYRNPHLVEPLIASLQQCGEELRYFCADVYLYNDSPEDQTLKSELEKIQDITGVPIKVITNPTNIGFVGTANVAFEAALADMRDIVLLNSDTRVFPGAFHELVEVAYFDPMIGFVSPRSNNATISTLPHGSEGLRLSPQDSYDRFVELASRLPRYSYVPTAVGFCLYIKASIIADFGGFDTVYGAGYNEENDLIMRANRRGYRAALANHAFVWHAGEQSFGLAGGKAIREQRNQFILTQRYPEYAQLIREYFESPEYVAERLIGTLRCYSKGEIHIGFDFSSMGTYYNGTFEAAKQLLFAAERTWPATWELLVRMSHAAWSFHGLDKCKRAIRIDVEETDRLVSCAIRIGQPFDADSVRRLVRWAPLTAIFMLDTIASDCGYLRIKFNQNIWHFVLRWIDIIFTNSVFTAAQFKRRYPYIPASKIITTIHSVDPNEYGMPVPTPPHGSTEAALLVIGNKFQHKELMSTVDELAKGLPYLSILALGATESSQPNVRCVESGLLAENKIDTLYEMSSAVVFPSHYEGFGFPILHALARRRPVYARKLPPFKEIAARLSCGAENIHWYTSNVDLIHMLRNGVARWRGADAVGELNGWERSAREVMQAISKELAAISVDVISERIRWFDLAFSISGVERHLSRVDLAARTIGSYAERVTARILSQPVVRKAGKVVVNGARRLGISGRPG